MDKHIIIDIPEAENDQALSEGLAKLGLTVHLAKDLTFGMLQGFNQHGEFDPKETLLIFPGNGSNIVRRYLPNDWLSQWVSYSILAKRIWKPGEDPRVFVGRASDCMILRVKQVIIVDDVVSSGTTVRAVRRLNEPWIPGATWNIMTWMIQAKTSTRGFREVLGRRVGDKDRLAPINSLSTLLENKEILRSYAKRNFSRPQNFVDLVESRK